MNLNNYHYEYDFGKIISISINLTAIVNVYFTVNHVPVKQDYTVSC